MAEGIENTEQWQRAFGHLKRKPLSEWGHQKRISLWLKSKYPDVRFVVSLAGLVHTGEYLGSMLRTLQWHEPGYPDMVIHAARGGYTMLAIELKKPGARTKKDHAARQESWLEYLRGEGAKAEVCVGHEEAINLIKRYLNGKA